MESIMEPEVVMLEDHGGRPGWRGSSTLDPSRNSRHAAQVRTMAGARRSAGRLLGEDKRCGGWCFFFESGGRCHELVPAYSFFFTLILQIKETNTFSCDITGCYFVCSSSCLQYLIHSQYQLYMGLQGSDSFLCVYVAQIFPFLLHHSISFSQVIPWSK